MRKLINCLLLWVLSTGAALAQPAAKITNVPDTSYTTYSDFQKNLKVYPFIKMVPDSPTTSVKENRNMVYCNIGNRQLHIDAFIPAKSKLKAVPAIIMVHGGGWRSGNRTQHIPLAQHLAALGYACFTVEYRLSTEALYPAPLNDIKSAIKWVRAQGTKFKVDTNKMAVLGFSAGGQIAALAGVTSGTNVFPGNGCNQSHSSDVQAVIDIDGTLSFVSPDAQETKNPQTVSYSAWWIGYPRTERLDLWAQASPLTYTDQNKVPFLFLNSNLERMHAGRDVFKKAMDEKHIYTEIVNFKDTPHSFCLYRPWFDDVVTNINSFMHKVFN